MLSNKAVKVQPSLCTPNWAAIPPTLEPLRNADLPLDKLAWCQQRTSSLQSPLSQSERLSSARLVIMLLTVGGGGCGEKGCGGGRGAERQSCSLMACKVISCGLVKLKAASLGCNSWQSCPPFTPANPSFRAFSHNHTFVEGGRKRGLCKAKTLANKKKWI